MRYRFPFLSRIALFGISLSFTSGALAQTPPGSAAPMTPEQMHAISQQFNKTNPAQVAAVSKQIPPEQAAAIAQQFHEQMKQSQNLAGGAVQAPVPLSAPSAPPEIVRAPDRGAIEKHANAIAAEEHAAQAAEDLKSAEAFEKLVSDVLPLSPDQIKRLHKYYDMTQAAKAASPTTPPTPQFSSIQVNLDPGSTSPVVRLATGFVTSLLFVDSSGEPWNITAYSIGDPQSFNIQWDQKSNALFIQSMKLYSHGNLAVRLHNLDTPVMITLVSGQKQVDFRVDLQIPGRGPNAKAVVVETGVNANVNPILLNILDGIPPMGSIKLGISGGPGDAWLYDGKIYYRTRLTVLSPAWLATVASADGTHVYELMVTPYIMGSENGKTVNIRLSGL